MPAASRPDAAADNDEAVLFFCEVLRFYSHKQFIQSPRVSV